MSNGAPGRLYKGPYRKFCALQQASIPFGSNPVTDHLFSSNSFRILHDGAAYIRREKIREISKWPEALKFLRVCYEGVEHDRNCCKCEKCIRTILSFRVMGLNLPECFEQDVRDDQILALTKLRGANLYYFEEILFQAKISFVSESWVTALDKCVKKNRHALDIDKSLMRKLRNKVAFRKRLRKLMIG